MHKKHNPLGATPTTQNGVAGYRFAVRSPLATTMVLCLFDNDNNESQYPMTRDDDDIWSVFVANIGAGQLYGFRADGHSTSKQPFNPQKLLLDPYAKGVIGKPKLAKEDDCAHFLMTDKRDNASVVPKSQLVDEHFDWGSDKHPQTPWAQTIIYEMHVKGFSQLNPKIPEAIRGSYAGLATPQAIDYLKQLGITAVELLPIAYGIDEPHLQRRGLHNYWNYNTLSPFAVKSNYWSGQAGSTPLTEFKTAVKALHTAGIEVILDVVFNHSAEAEHNHPSYCQRGLAHADFYWLNDEGQCLNDTGCGNTINCANPATQDWIIDCLCYWVEACHVDGFRFDLGSILGREPNFHRDAVLLQRLANEPRLANTKLIVEPWDIGAFGYQLGNFPAHFSEWNDRFRDDLRDFFVYQNGNLGNFATRFAGSSDIFGSSDIVTDNTRQPRNTVNLITAHDGFTLADLVAYNDKHNLANGEDNRDGHSHNISDNHGVEGSSDNVDIVNSRQHTQRALLSTLLLSNGTPMLLAGDEIGHSQGGNNNAYCQDNPTTWLDWENADSDLLAFTQQLIRYRQQIPSLNHNAWWSDANVTWLNVHGQPMQTHDWHDGECKALQIQLDNDFLLLVNGKRQPQTFTLPAGHWRSETDNLQHGSFTAYHLSIIILTKENTNEQI